MKKKISRGCAVLLACAMAGRAADDHRLCPCQRLFGHIQCVGHREERRRGPNPTRDDASGPHLRRGGVSYITVQESKDGGDTWTTLETFTKEDLNMYEEDTSLYYGTFDFEDTVIGRDYRALVGVYAERNGGGDLRSVYTNEVTAKR